MKAARTLDGRGRAVLRELYLLRDRCAREVNRPPFKVLSDLFLAEVARRLPKTDEELAARARHLRAGVRKVAPEVLEAVKSGCRGGAARPGRAPGGNGQRWRKGAPGRAAAGGGGALRTAARVA